MTHRALWDRRLGSLCRWWSSFEPIVSRADRTAREHRIAHHLVSAAIDAGKLTEVAIANPETGKRDPRRVWEAVHDLVASEWEFVKATTRAYIAEKEATHPRAAPVRERPAPPSSEAIDGLPAGGFAPGFDEFAGNP